MSINCELLVAGVLPDIKFRVKGVEVAAVQVVLGDPQKFAEPLVVHHFAFPQEFDGFAYVLVFDYAKDIVVGCARLLLRGHILM